jgi:hypothetical protein
MRCFALAGCTLVTLFLAATGCKGAAGNGPEGSQRIEKLDFECASRPVNKYMYYYSGRDSDDTGAEQAAKTLACDHKGSISIPNDPTHTVYKNCFCCPKP